MYVLCFTRPRYQVSVYRTIGPLVLIFAQNLDLGYMLELSTHDLCFRAKIRKKCIPLFTPVLLYESGVKGVHVSTMMFALFYLNQLHTCMLAWSLACPLHTQVAPKLALRGSGLFGINNVVRKRFVKISKVNIANPLLFFVGKNVRIFCTAKLANNWQLN